MHAPSLPPHPLLRRVGLVAGSVVVALAMTAPAVSAAQPARDPLDYPAQIDFPAGSACSFDVTLDVIVNNEYQLTYAGLRDGDQWFRVTGSLVVRAVHGDKSILVNISGPGFYIAHQDGTATSISYGNAIGYGSELGLMYTSGRVVEELGSDGSILSWQAASAHTTQLCDALA